MKGERKMPTITLTASADQLEPTFFRICVFSYFRIGSGPFPSFPSLPKRRRGHRWSLRPLRFAGDQFVPHLRHDIPPSCFDLRYRLRLQVRLPTADRRRADEWEIARRRSAVGRRTCRDRKSTRLNSSHTLISYAVLCFEKKKNAFIQHTN